MMPTNYCARCAAHYGDNGQCDEGKAAASPHRVEIERRRKRNAATWDRWLARSDTIINGKKVSHGTP